MEKLKELGVGVRPLDDPLFDEGNTICRIYTQKGVVDQDVEQLCHIHMKRFECNAAGCSESFDSLLNYEMHYNWAHRFSCSECNKHLPSPHLLDLHVSETHDNFFKVQAERKPMYRCFVEECTAVSADVLERRDHCIREHQFPHDFRFDTAHRKKGSKRCDGAGAKGELGAGTTAFDPSKGRPADNRVQPPPTTQNEGRKVNAVKNVKFGKKSSARTFEWHRARAGAKGAEEGSAAHLQMHQLMDTLPNI